MKRGRPAFRPVSTVLLALLLIGALIPVYWMAMSSFKTDDEIYLSDPTWVPANPTLDNYKALFRQFGFARLTLNSAAITLGVVAVSLAFGTMAAYGFSRYRFRGSGLLMAAFLLTRMITPTSLVVPLYSLMKSLGLLNNVVSIGIGIAVLNLPFVVWIMKPFFDQLPKEIEEASALDGLSPKGVFLRIAVPMAAPGLFSVLIFSFISGWVDLLFGITFASSANAMPLTAGLMQMQTGYKIYWGPLMAGGVYLSIPTMLLAFFFQKSLVNGLRISA